jgi:hypothetical protein
MQRSRGGVGASEILAQAIIADALPTGFLLTKSTEPDFVTPLFHAWIREWGDNSDEPLSHSQRRTP